MIKILLVDDHAMVLAGFRLILGQANDIEIVGEAENGEAAGKSQPGAISAHADLLRLVRLLARAAAREHLRSETATDQESIK